MSDLTSMRRLQLETRLNEAETAYANLVMGRGVRVVVDQNGERMEFTPASSSRLAQYIQSLKIELGLMETRPPARIFW